MKASILKVASGQYVMDNMSRSECTLTGWRQYLFTDPYKAHDRIAKSLATWEAMYSRDGGISGHGATPPRRNNAPWEAAERAGYLNAHLLIDRDTLSIRPLI